MKQWMRGRFLFYVASVLLVLEYMLFWFLDNPAGIEELRYAGWVLFTVGIVLIFLPMFVFRSKSKVKKERVGPRPQSLLTQEYTLLFDIRFI